MQNLAMDRVAEEVRLTVVDIFTQQQITSGQYASLERLLGLIFQYGNETQKKSCALYLYTARTNLPEGLVVRNQLNDFELGFRAACSPLLDKLDAFIPDQENINDVNYHPSSYGVCPRAA